MDRIFSVLNDNGETSRKQFDEIVKNLKSDFPDLNIVESAYNFRIFSDKGIRITDDNFVSSVLFLKYQSPKQGEVVKFLTIGLPYYNFSDLERMQAEEIHRAMYIVPQEIGSTVVYYHTGRCWQILTTNGFNNYNFYWNDRSDCRYNTILPECGIDISKLDKKKTYVMYFHHKRCHYCLDNGFELLQTREFNFKNPHELKIEDHLIGSEKNVKPDALPAIIGNSDKQSENNFNNVLIRTPSGYYCIRTNFGKLLDKFIYSLYRSKREELKNSKIIDLQEDDYVNLMDIHDNFIMYCIENLIKSTKNKNEILSILSLPEFLKLYTNLQNQVE